MELIGIAPSPRRGYDALDVDEVVLSRGGVEEIFRAGCCTGGAIAAAVKTGLVTAGV